MLRVIVNERCYTFPQLVVTLVPAVILLISGIIATINFLEIHLGGQPIYTHGLTQCLHLDIFSCLISSWLVGLAER